MLTKLVSQVLRIQMVVDLQNEKQVDDEVHDVSFDDLHL